MAGILIIEDDITFSSILEGFLTRHGYLVTAVHNIKDGKRYLQEHSFNIILLDYRLPDGTGMDILETARQLKLKVPIIMMTSFNDIRTAVKAMRMGAHEYITKPVNPDELLMVLQELKEEKKEEDLNGNGQVQGNSPTAQKLQEHIKLVAPTDMSVILQGESGTGKELAARTIHRFSKRAAHPFVAIDCGALSADLAASELFGHSKGAFTGALQDKKGQFEVADGGTLFLDEVGNLSYEVQVKLLRALQERVIQPLGSNRNIKVDVRIITATNDDLLQSVKDGKFREDLYHRLNEFKIQIPPLQQRREDLPLFIDHFVQLANKELNKNIKGVATDVKQLLENYEWPGNIRELKNIIKRAVLLSPGPLIEMDALPDEMILTTRSPETTGLKAIQELNEKEQILKVLQETRYNKSKTARILNIDRTTLYYKMAKYGIEG